MKACNFFIHFSLSGETPRIQRVEKHMGSYLESFRSWGKKRVRGFSFFLHGSPIRLKKSEAQLGHLESVPYCFSAMCPHHCASIWT